MRDGERDVGKRELERDVGKHELELEDEREVEHELQCVCERELWRALLDDRPARARCRIPSVRNGSSCNVYKQKVKYI